MIAQWAQEEETHSLAEVKRTTFSFLFLSTERERGNNFPVLPSPAPENAASTKCTFFITFFRGKSLTPFLKILDIEKNSRYVAIIFAFSTSSSSSSFTSHPQVFFSSVATSCFPYQTFSLFLSLSHSHSKRRRKTRVFVSSSSSSSSFSPAFLPFCFYGRKKASEIPGTSKKGAKRRKKNVYIGLRWRGDLIGKPC